MVGVYARPHFDVDEVKTAAKGRWLEILPAIDRWLEDACAVPGRHVPCPKHGGRDGFRMFPDAAETGGGVSNKDGAFPDGLAVLQWLTGYEFSNVLARVAQYIGVKPDQWFDESHSGGNYNSSIASLESSESNNNDGATDTSHRHGARRENRSSRDHLAKVETEWQEATPDTGRIAEYLRFRGLTLDVPESLRLLPKCTYWKSTDECGVQPGGHFPAMIARMCRGNGRFIGLHHTYLANVGPGKAPVRSPKKLVAAPSPGWHSGAAIRLYEATDVVAVTEGIETGLAIHQVTGVPVWSAYSSSNLARIEIPPAIENVEVWADRGDPGEKDAFLAAERLAGAGHSVRLLIPPPSYSDWLDVLVGAKEGEQ